MRTITVTEARANIFRLMEKIAESHEPVLITGKNANTVMVSEEDWRSIEETLYLSSIPGMVESLIEARNTPIEECIDADKVEW